MIPGHATQPWEAVEIDLICVGVTSLAHTDNLLLAIYKASKLLFAFPIPLKQADEVARKLVQPFLTFGFLRVKRCGGGREFGAIVIQYICRCLKTDIQLKPAEHLRA